DVRRGGARRVRVLPARRAARPRHAPARARADLARRAGRPRPPAPERPQARARAPPLPLREPVAPGRPLSVAARARRPPPPPRLVRGCDTRGRSPCRARVHDRSRMRAFFARMNPTLRGFLIILVIVGVIVVLNLETALLSLTIIARVAFLLAIAFFVFL